MTNYSWDQKSAFRKATSNVTVTVTAGPISVGKETTSHNPKTDAYRSCSNCKKHVNYHKDSKCPDK